MVIVYILFVCAIEYAKRHGIEDGALVETEKTP